MNTDLEYLPVEEVKTEGSLYKVVNYKPYFAIVSCLIMGAVLLIVGSLIAKLIGLFFVAMAGITQYAVKDYKVMDIFDKGIELYGDKEAQTAAFISFDDITSWVIKKDRGSAAEIKLSNGLSIVRDTFQANKIYRTLDKFIPEKEENRIRQAEERKQPLNLQTVLQNIRSRFTKK
ncbi:MAG: hypothetical protein IJM15_02375 [Erysipelotrichaceae bacterium]|nr:hypothetical protein [Erysipelotrichaceae bacterium]